MSQVGSVLANTALSLTLSGNAGISPFLTMFLIGIAAKVQPEYLPLDETMDKLMTSWPSLSFWSIMTILESIGKCVPSDRYYPLVVNAKDWSTGGNLSTLFVKQKAGHLSYLQDPNGLRSLSMQTGSGDRASFLKSIALFSNERPIHRWGLSSLVPRRMKQ